MNGETGKRMWKKSAVVCIALVFFGCLVRFFQPSPAGKNVFFSSDEPFVQEFSVFNTQCRVTVYDGSQGGCQAMMAELLREMRHLHETLNAYDPSSELSTLNQRAGEEEVVCSDLLWEVILAARDGWRDSEGLFDVTVGPLLEMWGFHAKRSLWPPQSEVEAALEKVGFGKVVLDESRHSVRFRVAGMKLDFGGIAKGFALGKAKGIVCAHGFRSFLIDMGGNLCCS